MRRFQILLILFVLAAPLYAGGAWVPEAGKGEIQLGFSRKTAHTSWDAYGEVLEHSGRFQNHDFRYTYLWGEVGVGRGWSVDFLVSWLDGREGPDGDLHRNAGWSDIWLGAKYGWGRSDRPMAVRLEVRSPVLYDISGPYSLELYDRDGNFVANSPEWRGLLKHDVTAYFLHSRSLADGKGWASFEVGYMWREGAPADQLPINIDAGWTLPWHDLKVKGSLVYRQSLGNDSERRPDDRFGSRPGYNFNDASMARVGLSLILPFGKDSKWSLEAGHNKWIWGRSARRYDEPFLCVSRSF